MPKKNFLNNLVGSSWTRSDERKRDNQDRSRSSTPSKWHEKSCSNCGQTIRYHEDWENIPSVCSSCKSRTREDRQTYPREQRESSWREKSCDYCGTTIRYNVNWANIPAYCNECKNREFEKPCSTHGCENTIRYKLHYRDVPDMCRYCQKMSEQGAEESTCIDCGGLLWVPQGKNYKRCKSCSEGNKRTKPCKNPLCSNLIEYYPNDEKEYDYCRECTSWKEKACAVATCNNVIRYMGFWDNIPSYCESHLSEMRTKHRPRYEERISEEYPSIHSTLPGTDSTAADMGGDKVKILTFADGHKHVTVSYLKKGVSGFWRYSWNVDSSGEYIRESAHLTDESSDSSVRKQFSDQKRWFNG